jgi:hypothetical protein
VACIFPTIAKWIGAKLPKHKLDSLDVWRIITGEPARFIATPSKKSQASGICADFLALAREWNYRSEP